MILENCEDLILGNKIDIHVHVLVLFNHMAVSQLHIHVHNHVLYIHMAQKLAQKWLVCAPLRLHLEPIKRALWANGAPYELIKNTEIHVHVYVVLTYIYMIYQER